MLLPIQVTNDLADELDQTVIITLSVPVNAVFATGGSQHTFTILDNDVAIVGFAAAASSGPESADATLARNTGAFS